MGKRTVFECDGCPTVYPGDTTHDYRPGGWVEWPLVGGYWTLCPECSTAVYKFIADRKRMHATVKTTTDRAAEKNESVRDRKASPSSAG